MLSIKEPVDFSERLADIEKHVSSVSTDVKKIKPITASDVESIITEKVDLNYVNKLYRAK